LHYMSQKVSKLHQTLPPVVMSDANWFISDLIFRECSYYKTFVQLFCINGNLNVKTGDCCCF
jgi:hypothetical protein